MKATFVESAIYTINSYEKQIEKLKTENIVYKKLYKEQININLAILAEKKSLEAENLKFQNELSRKEIPEIPDLHCLYEA